MKKNKLPNIISILILTLLTIIMWISFSVYRAIAEKPSPSVESSISEPVTPRLDTETIKKIESSVFLDSSQIPQNVVTQTIVSAIIAPTITPRPATSPTATSSASPTASPVASASASPTGTPTP